AGGIAWRPPRKHWLARGVPKQLEHPSDYTEHRSASQGAPCVATDDAEPGTRDEHGRPLRADARRNVDALLRAAMRVFAQSGVDAPMRSIAAEAGVGVGTLYRHFPQRSDII